MNKSAQYCLPYVYTTAGFTLLLMLLMGSAQAQLQVVPGTAQPTKHSLQERTPTVVRMNSSEQARYSLDTLPFWDDFSYIGLLPLTEAWSENTTASITYGLAVRPPTLGVVSFDGIDASGAPYSQANTSGPADMLESDSINLAGLSDAEKAGVFLSFFWQLQGLGERPDQFDFLRLQFLDADTVWHDVWSKSGAVDVATTTFQKELLSLQQEGNARGVNFFHPGFRFRFQSFNRLNGQFDLWHVDYVYLNKGRSADAPYINDQAISSGFTSLLKPYTAMPLHQFFASPEKYLNDSILNTFHNLESPTSPSEGGETYALKVRTHTGEAVATLKEGFPIRSGGAILSGQTYITMRDILELQYLLPFADRDSLYLESVVTLANAIPEGLPLFSRNDTTLVRTVLHDYYAYDDGTAEAGVSLNGRDQRLAYRFALEVPDKLVGISAYFPFFKESSFNKSITLKVWSSLAGVDGAVEDTLVYSQVVNLTASEQPDLNEFIYIAFNNALELEAGDFFIGYEQTTPGELPIGFDRNTDSSDEIFYSVNGVEWLNNFPLEGSLMLRPYFDRYTELPTGIEEHHFPPVAIYPNPARHKLWIASEALALQLLDAQGRPVLQQKAQLRTEIDIKHLPAGIYLLQLQYREGIQSKRIIIVH